MFDTILNILFVVLGFSFLIFIHELGHYLAARVTGVKVEEFGIGMPPRAWGKKIGDTIYSLNWLPIGGFVQLKGQSDFDPKKDLEISDQPDSYIGKNPWQRLLIISAGVIFNFIAAIGIMMTAYMIGVTPMEGNQYYNQMIEEKDASIMVHQVIEGSLAEDIGLISGDLIVSIDDIQVRDLETYQQAIQDKSQFILDIKRGESEDLIQITATPDSTGKLGMMLVLGIELDKIQLGIVDAFITSCQDAIHLVDRSIQGFVTLFNTLIESFALPEGLSGPVGIVQMTSAAADAGWTEGLKFLALISISLAVLNALPFPALDGGRAFFLLIE